MGRILLLVVMNLLFFFQLATFSQSTSTGDFERIERTPTAAHGSKNCRVEVPQAFTPNGDGINDQLKISCSCDTKSFLFEVYNASGRFVYGSRNSSLNWDGKTQGAPLPEGYYSWKVTFIRYGTEEKHSEKGKLIIAR